MAIQHKKCKAITEDSEQDFDKILQSLLAKGNLKASDLEFKQPYMHNVDTLDAYLHAAAKQGTDNFTYADAEILGLIDPAPHDSIDCADLGLTSLAGAPEHVEGHFDCANNKLTDFKGGPKEITGNLYCAGNKITDLSDFPVVKGLVFCNPELKADIEALGYTIGGI